MEFIECKAKEEEGPHADRGGLRGSDQRRGLSSVMFQNANFSVRVTDEFLRA